MTKQEKIEKIKQLLEELETEETEEETPIFPRSAIVFDIDRQRYCLNSHATTPERIIPYALACTAAVDIPDAKWAAVDENGTMLWYKDEPKMYERMWNGLFCTYPMGDAYMLPCKVDNWKNAKWRIR
jgi:hypothetical protein